MEKVKVSWIKISLIAGVSYLLMKPLFNVELVSFQYQLQFMIGILIVFTLIDILDYFVKKGVFFSPEGITWIVRGNIKHFKSWDTIKLEKKID